MARKEEFSLSPGDASLDRGQTDPVRGFSSSDPEEGHRLMRIFFSIKRPALRQAIVKIVMVLSKLDVEKQ